jgi:hypothetical protein
MSNKLKGSIQSGIIFVGDPAYMAGDTREGADNSLCNPFVNWDMFTAGLEGKDVNMTFPGSLNDNTTGRGCVIQTGRLSGQYEIEKQLNENGELSQIIIRFKD